MRKKSNAYCAKLDLPHFANDDLYERLIDKLTEPVEFHNFILPSTKNTYSFVGYISSLSDEMEKILSDTVKFKGLTCKYIAKKPFRVPG